MHGVGNIERKFRQGAVHKNVSEKKAQRGGLWGQNGNHIVGGNWGRSIIEKVRGEYTNLGKVSC